MNRPTLPRTLLSARPAAGRTRPLSDMTMAIAGLVAAPYYLVRAGARDTPGLEFRRRCSWLGLRHLIRGGGGLSLRELYQLITYPMDSVRYFEFDFAWQRIRALRARSYLDVSSPRLLPLVYLLERPDLQAVLLNPDRQDLPVTKRYADALGVAQRCRFVPELIGAVDLADDSMDLVTCLSVLEHIPADRSAVRRMWQLLRPGGRLVMTVPCAAMASEEYVNQDKYGLLQPGSDGFVFWQRYYDARLLEENVYSETGPPAVVRVYGEIRKGSYARNVEDKMMRPSRYPFWREPYMMATQYRYFDALEELPGMGVVGLEFHKS